MWPPFVWNFPKIFQHFFLRWKWFVARDKFQCKSCLWNFNAYLTLWILFNYTFLYIDLVVKSVFLLQLMTMPIYLRIIQPKMCSTISDTNECHRWMFDIQNVHVQQFNVTIMDMNADTFIQKWIRVFIAWKLKMYQPSFVNVSHLRRRIKWHHIQLSAPR